MINFIKKYFHITFLSLFLLGVLLVNLKINIFRYDNFDFGKFDLGNMTQMVWNTLHGRFMYLTDYFGTNLPRWAMSHVDPILLVFVPIFALIPHPMTLTYSQILLILFSCFLVYKIALLELNSKTAALFFALAYLFYPSIGFLTAWTGFHGVSAVIPFLFAAFYLYEKMYKEQKFTKNGIILFWVFLVLTMMGKEQLPIYVALYGLFILFFRNPSLDELKVDKSFFRNFIKLPATKISFAMLFVGITWFVVAFFVIIPAYAPYRVEGYAQFAKSLNINNSGSTDVALPNYFLSRYDALGDSYGDIFMGVLSNPRLVVDIVFGGDKLDNLIKTFGPLSYLPLLYPQFLLLAIPDLLINYLTSSSGVATSEITNHRISMIIPVLFISTIYAVSLLSRKIGSFRKIKSSYLILFFSGLVLGSNIYMTFYSNNPVYLWLTQAIQKKVFAKTDVSVGLSTTLKVGDVVRLTELEDKDRECAQKVVKMIPNEASVSGPDYLGAHLSMRETYAIFPALYDKADYVIVDIFSRKLLTILGINLDLARGVVEKIIKNENYELVAGCGNLFVFKNVGPHGKSSLLPLQERFSYEEKFNTELFQSLYVVDYLVPPVLERGVANKLDFTYIKRENSSLDEYFMFLTYVNAKTGEILQAANLPSFGIIPLEKWEEDRYYIETLDTVIPPFVAPGRYRLFIGMGNNVRTRSMYIGDVEIK